MRPALVISVPATTPHVIAGLGYTTDQVFDLIARMIQNKHVRNNAIIKYSVCFQTRKRNVFTNAIKACPTV